MIYSEWSSECISSACWVHWRAGVVVPDSHLRKCFDEPRLQLRTFGKSITRLGLHHQGLVSIRHRHGMTCERSTPEGRTEGAVLVVFDEVVEEGSDLLGAVELNFGGNKLKTVPLLILLVSFCFEPRVNFANDWCHLLWCWIVGIVWTVLATLKFNCEFFFQLFVFVRFFFFFSRRLSFALLFY